MPVRLEHVQRRYGDRVVLRDVDLELESGRHVVVAGENGSGKSTLLRIVAGVVPPSCGRVAGRPPRVAHLPERFAPPPLMRADAYLRHVGRIAGMPTRAAADRLADLLERLAIHPDPRRRFGALSKGNAQKAGIAQAFLAGHDLIVLDEPRTGLDTAADAVLDELIAEHTAAGGLVVASEHDPARLSRGGPVLRVRDGTVVPEVVAAPRFRVRVAREGAQREELVDGAPDAVLRRLLDAGWSVLEVRSEGGA